MSMTTTTPRHTLPMRPFRRARAGAGGPPGTIHRPPTAPGVRRTARGVALGARAARARVATRVGGGGAQAEGRGAGSVRAVVAEGQASTTTDKAAYLVGEPITVSYTLPG